MAGVLNMGDSFNFKWPDSAAGSVELGITVTRIVN